MAKATVCLTVGPDSTGAVRPNGFAVQWRAQRQKE